LLKELERNQIEKKIMERLLQSKVEIWMFNSEKKSINPIT
jgi:hypothetical protein